jgi:hypothetical protein
VPDEINELFILSEILLAEFWPALARHRRFTYVQALSAARFELQMSDVLPTDRNLP